MVKLTKSPASLPASTATCQKPELPVCRSRSSTRGTFASPACHPVRLLRTDCMSSALAVAASAQPPSRAYSRTCAATIGGQGVCLPEGQIGEVSVKGSEPREPRNPTKSEEYQRRLQ
eukprot:9123185-Pyramimonas_sp.AAC.1